MLKSSINDIGKKVIQPQTIPPLTHIPKEFTELLFNDKKTID
jgi:hypothetical protein